MKLNEEKSYSELCDIFRDLRLCNPQISEVCGFASPKEGTDECVTKVEVEFSVELFVFKIRTIPLQMKIDMVCKILSRLMRT